MSEPDYVAAVKILKEHYGHLCTRAAEEILSDRARSEELLDELLINDYQRFCAIDTVYSHLERRIHVKSLVAARKAQSLPKRVAELPPKARPKLRVAALHCRADIVTETINEWLAKHTEIEVLSINFTQLGSGLACVILHRTN